MLMVRMATASVKGTWRMSSGSSSGSSVERRLGSVRYRSPCDRRTALPVPSASSFRHVTRGRSMSSRREVRAASSPNSLSWEWPVQSSPWGGMFLADGRTEDGYPGGRRFFAWGSDPFDIYREPEYSPVYYITSFTTRTSYVMWLALKKRAKMANSRVCILRVRE